MGAYLALARALDRSEIWGEAFNCGTDEPMSVLEMTDLILSLSPHPDLKPVVLDKVKNEIKDQYLDCSKIQRMVGWTPATTRIEALRETVAWYAAYLEG